MEYKGFKFQPIVMATETEVDSPGTWYEYTIKGWRGRRSCVIRGQSLFRDPDKAAQAAIEFSESKIDEHLSKFYSSLFYRFICTIGYCPASKY